jgi:hypothetical protein
MLIYLPVSACHHHHHQNLFPIKWSQLHESCFAISFFFLWPMINHL